MGSLGVSEMLVILVVALIIFGPRKLPELGKTLGEGLAQFRKASEDFKRTWESEVEYEKKRFDTPRPAVTQPIPSEPEATAPGSDAAPDPPLTAPEGTVSASEPIEPVVEEVPATTFSPAAAQPAVETKRDWM